MKNLLNDLPWKKILRWFLIWRISLFIVAFFAPFILPIFGNRFPYVNEMLISTGLPNWVWSFGNFDGVHYLGIAQNGYLAQYTQAFFPLYPLLIKLLSINGSYLISALIISNIFFLISLLLIYKLFRLDFNENISLGAVALLISFPTAYYFGSIYTESLFLLLSVVSIYLARKERFILASLFVALASATRIIGLCLIPVVLIEIYQKEKFRNLLNYLIALVIGSLGTVFYMFYLKINFNNPLYFLTAQPDFGASRSNQPFVLLPQVTFRYIKIFLTVNTKSLLFFNSAIEFLFTLAPIIYVVTFFKKIRFSYWIFIVLSLLLPTLTGTFSSMPRYALMSFLSFSVIVVTSKRYFKFIVVLFIILQVIFVAMFTRGYWIA